MWSHQIGLGLLLPDFLTFDSVLEVKSAEGSYSDSFISIDPVEADCALE